jgi:DNA-binding MarR family transcriptional regulator
MPRTPVPDAAARGLRVSIAALVRRFSLSERADVSCCGMTIAQAATLTALREQGPLRLGHLGARLGIQASTLSRNLARLEERGLVRRRPDPDDARAMRVGLSPTGRRAAERVELQELEFARQILEQIPADRRDEVLAAIGTLMRAVHRATLDCCGNAFDHLMENFPDAGPCRDGCAGSAVGES